MALPKPRSVRYCLSYPRDSQFSGRYHELVRQSKNSKALFSQPRIAVHVGNALLRDLVAWTVNFDDEPMFEADKMGVKVAEGDLSLKPQPRICGCERPAK